MDIKLTAAQKKLITTMKANPGTDAKEHLRHIRNQAIADEMVEKLLKFGVLQVNPENQIRELAPSYIEMVPVVLGDETVREEIPGVKFGTNESLKDRKAFDLQVIERVESIQAQKISKKALILEMLQTKVSLAEMVKTTGWEEKSVRGVMSQLKKEKHLNICREKDENKQNFYYITADVKQV